MSQPSAQDARLVAVAAAVPLVTAGMTVGLGSGRAVFALADAIGATPVGREIRVVVASPETERRAMAAGLEVVDLDDAAPLELAIDGADEIDPNLDLIKGGGAALLREKLVLATAQRVVIVAEATKAVDRLGSTRRLPIEIVRFGWRSTIARLTKRFDTAIEVRLDDRGAPLETDEGHRLVEMTVPIDIRTAELAAELDSVVGVVDHGFFLGLATDVLLGHPDGAVEHRIRQSSTGWAVPDYP